LIEDNVAELPQEAFSRGIGRLVKRDAAKQVVILGFDTEYDSETKEIVCYQLSDGTNSSMIERTRDFTWEDLAEWVRSCLRCWGFSLRESATIMLVSHFSTAELSHIKDFHKYALIRRVSPQQVYNATYRINEHSRLYVMDQYHFFNTGLAKVAGTFGEQKLEFDTTKVSRRDLASAKFREYSLWDAIVCARIFHKFRQRLLEQYQVDVVHYPTPASLAMAVYRQHFLPDSFPAPENEVRRQAWLSLWGGRAEAYVQGDAHGAYTLRDVKSLYPSSARLLRELPRGGDWVRREQPRSWQGLCRVRFRFPASIKFPCLPMYHDGRLIFPLQGTSDCTLQEARVALQMGAKLEFAKVFEYDSGDDSLARYMDFFVSEKDRSEKEGDKVGRELSKLMMNALIGKISQNRGDVDIEDMKKFADEEGIPLEVALDPTFIHPMKPKSAPRIGGHIMPEWSALILGKARAVMAELMHEIETSAPEGVVSNLITSTDSLLVPDELNEAVDVAMRRVGVILTSKNEGKTTARVRVVRSRVYAAEADDGTIVFGAAHAVHLSRQAGRECPDCKIGTCRRPLHDSLRFVLSDETKYPKVQRLGLKTAIRTGRRFFDDNPIPEMTFARQWDQKRRLLKGGKSRPWQSIDEYDQVVNA